MQTPRRSTQPARPSTAPAARATRLADGRGAPGPAADRIQVAVRVRPPPAHSTSVGVQPWSTTSALVHLPSEPRTFAFDRVFGPASSQHDLFEAVGLPIADAVLGGFNGNLLTYGQTGAGKTFTMFGSDANPGLAPRILRHLYDAMGAIAAAGGVRFECSCTFVQIHNDQLTDLLAATAAGSGAGTPRTSAPPPPPLRLREGGGRTFVEGATERPLRTAADAQRALAGGAASRLVAATSLNAASSRSHAVFRLTVRRLAGGASRTSLLSLVDLAGSERQPQERPRPAERRAAQHRYSGAVPSPQPSHSLARSTSCYINQSLSALGNVITALAADAASGAASGEGAAATPGRHVPFRDSRLTMLLRDALGGDSKTTLVANVCACGAQLAESVSTLQFARRAKLVRTHATLQRAELADSPASATATAVEPDPRWAARRLQHAFRHWTLTRTAAPPPSASPYEVAYRAPAPYVDATDEAAAQLGACALSDGGGASAAAASPAEGLASDVNESLRAATDRVEAARRAQQRARAAVDAEATPLPPPSRRPPPIPEEEEEAGGELAVTPRRTGGRRSSGPLYSAGGTATQSYVPFAVPPDFSAPTPARPLDLEATTSPPPPDSGAAAAAADAPTPGDTADAAVLDASLPGGSQLVSPGLSASLPPALPPRAAPTPRRWVTLSPPPPPARKEDDDERASIRWAISRAVACAAVQVGAARAVAERAAVMREASEAEAAVATGAAAAAMAEAAASEQARRTAVAAAEVAGRRASAAASARMEAESSAAIAVAEGGDVASERDAAVRAAAAARAEAAALRRRRALLAARLAAAQLDARAAAAREAALAAALADADETARRAATAIVPAVAATPAVPATPAAATPAGGALVVRRSPTATPGTRATRQSGATQARICELGRAGLSVGEIDRTLHREQFKTSTGTLWPAKNDGRVVVRMLLRHGIAPLSGGDTRIDDYAREYATKMGTVVEHAALENAPPNRARAIVVAAAEIVVAAAAADAAVAADDDDDDDAPIVEAVPAAPLAGTSADAPPLEARPAAATPGVAAAAAWRKEWAQAGLGRPAAGGRVPAAANAAGLVVGARVSAKFNAWRGGTRWYPGAIAGANESGTFRVAFDDGDVDEKVAPRHIHVLPPLRGDDTGGSATSEASATSDDARIATELLAKLKIGASAAAAAASTELDALAQRRASRGSLTAV